MLGYGHVLAHAGYAVMLWDFDGHGANPTPLKQYETRRALELAMRSLLEQPEVDPTRLALLGHSMGSGIVMSEAIVDTNRFAATVVYVFIRNGVVFKFVAQCYKVETLALQEFCHLNIYQASLSNLWREIII